MRGGPCKSRTVACALLTWLLPVGAQAANDCSVEVSSISFGGINVLPSLPIDSVGAPIVVTCTGDSGTVNLSVGLSAGAGSGATGATRYMQLSANPSYQMAYSLYSSSANRSSGVYWGDSGSSLYATTITVTNNTGSRNISVYGRLFGAQQSAKSGSYTDILTVTVAY